MAFGPFFKLGHAHEARPFSYIQRAAVSGYTDIRQMGAKMTRLTVGCRLQHRKPAFDAFLHPLSEQGIV
jgi:hypothetical protein